MSVYKSFDSHPTPSFRKSVEICNFGEVTVINPAIRNPRPKCHIADPPSRIPKRRMAKLPRLLVQRPRSGTTEDPFRCIIQTKIVSPEPVSLASIYKEMKSLSLRRRKNTTNEKNVNVWCIRRDVVKSSKTHESYRWIDFRNGDSTREFTVVRCVQFDFVLIGLFVNAS